jgi:succinoglycan biosynthesis transport protein ExoP
MAHTNPDSASLRNYLRIVRRRKWIILQAVILVPVAAYLVSAHRQPLYRASAEVLLANQNLASSLSGLPDASASQPDRNAETQAGLARVPEIARRVVAAAGLRGSPLDFLSRSGVSGQGNSDLLRFWVVDKNPDQAARLASVYASQFRDYRRELDTTGLAQARGEVLRRIARLRVARQLDSGLYARLVDKEQQLATMATLQTSNVLVVGPADHAQTIRPRPKRDAALGLALGVLLGIGLALMREALDTRPHSAEEIGDRLGFSLLGRLPRPPRKFRAAGRLLTAAHGGPQGEAFRMLKTNLEFVNLERNCRSIMITSAVKGEGKSTTAANLAVTIARAGRRVALVDLDIRKPTLHRFFDLEGKPGIMDVALGKVALDEALTRLTLPAADGEVPAAPANGNGQNGAAGFLDVLVAGTVPPNPGEVVGSASVGQILMQLRADFDLVLVDSPPLLHVGDALALSTNVDGILLVTRLNVIDHRMLGELARLLEKSPAETLGFVLTDALADEDYGYGSGYGYGSSGSEAATQQVAWRSSR